MKIDDITKASVAYNEKNGKLRVIGGSNILSDEEYFIWNKNPDFIAGAKWMKEQLMKDAIKTRLYGEEIKVIIIKEDEK